jgi:hypothetical protein
MLGRFRSDEQRKAIFASMASQQNAGSAGAVKRQAPQYRNWFRRHPIATGLGASSLTTALFAAALTGGRQAKLMRSLSGGTTPKQMQRILRAAKKLYPQTTGILKTKGGGGIVSKGPLADMAEAMGGGAFMTGRVSRAGARVSILSRILSRTHPKIGEIVTKMKGLGPTILAPRADIRIRNLFSTEKQRVKLMAGVPIFAHELGHAATQLGRFGKLKQSALGTSIPLTKEGTALLGSLAAHPIIAHSKLSEKRKRQLHIAAGLAPLGFAAPMLADEALASYRGLRILKAAGASRRRLKLGRRQLGLAYSTYLGVAVPGALGGGLAGSLYAKRARERGSSAR